MAGQVPQDVHELGVEDGGRFKVFAGGGGAGEDEDARADDGADAERGERPGAKAFLQPVAGFGGLGNQPVDRLAGKQLICQRSAPASRLVKPWRMRMDFSEGHDSKQSGHLLREIPVRREWPPRNEANYRLEVPRAAFLSFCLAEPRS
jgi:hypothetical protein